MGGRFTEIGPGKIDRYNHLSLLKRCRQWVPLNCPIGRAACWRRWSASTSRRASRCRRRCSRAKAASACRRRPSGTSSPSSKSLATSISRIPRPAACRRIAAIACSSICCSRAASPARPRQRRASDSPAGRSFAAHRRPAGQRLAPRLARRASRRLRAGRQPRRVLQRIEFVPLGGSRVLVVVVSRGNQVTQKVVDAGGDAPAGRSGPGGKLPEHRVRRPAAARRARGGARAAAAGATASTTSCWRARCAWRSRRSTSCPPSRRSTSKARRRCSTTRRRQRVEGDAARAARDDGREGAPGAPAQPVHRRSRPDGRDWRRARRARPSAVQPDRLRRPWTARRPARSASSDRRACTTRARSRWWTARRRRSRACCATQLNDHDGRTHRTRSRIGDGQPQARRDRGARRPNSRRRSTHRRARRAAGSRCCARPPTSTTTASGSSASAASCPSTRPRESPARAAADHRQLRAGAAGAGGEDEPLPQGRRADPQADARPAAQARRHADRRARRRLRPERAPGRHPRAERTSIAKAK